MKKSMTTTSRISKFLSNVSKLDMYVHKRTSDGMLGTVTLKKAGYETRNGKRLYAVSSKVIPSGCHGAAALRKAFTAIA